MSTNTTAIDDISPERLLAFAEALTELCQQHRIAIAGKVATYPLTDPSWMPDGNLECLRYEVDAQGYIFN